MLWLILVCLALRVSSLHVKNQLVAGLTTNTTYNYHRHSIKETHCKSNHPPDLLHQQQQPSEACVPFPGVVLQLLLADSYCIGSVNCPYSGPSRNQFASHKPNKTLLPPTTKLPGSGGHKSTHSFQFKIAPCEHVGISVKNENPVCMRVMLCPCLHTALMLLLFSGWSLVE